MNRKMANIGAKKIKRELKEVIKCKEAAECGIKVELRDDDFNELKGEIAGPPDTPYEGGKFTLEIKIPHNYPFQPPKVRFLSKIWHPNISSATGAMCWDILKNQWSAAASVRSVLFSLQALLSAAEPDDPQDAVVARQFKENPRMFDLTARHWTKVYAGGSSQNQDFDEKIEQLSEMGINEIHSRATLSSCDWDLMRAINEYFN